MRRWHAGFEARSDGAEFLGPSDITNFAHDTTIMNPGGGIVSGRFSGGTGYLSSLTGLACGNGIWPRTYFRVGGTPSAEAAVFGLYNAAGTVRSQLALTTDRKLKVKYAGAGGLTASGVSGFALTAGTWYLLEMFTDAAQKLVRARIGSAAGVPYGISWFDGVLPFSGTDAIDHVRFGPVDANPGTTFHYDDCAINDPSGTLNCGWCGPEVILLTVPAADVAGGSGWVAQGGGDHWAAIDDLASGNGLDAGVTYIKNTDGGFGEHSQWTFTRCPAIGAVSAVLWGVYGGGDGTSSRTVNLQIGDRAAPYTVPPYTYLEGPTFELNLNGWRVQYPAATAEEQWNGSGRMLTTQAIDKTLGRLFRRGGTGEVRVSAVWAMVALRLPTPTIVRAGDKPRGLLELEAL